MDENVLRGKWKQFRGEIKERWGRLTDDQLDMVEGRRDQMVGLLQEHYGYTRQRAENEYDDFVNELDDNM